MTKSIDEQITAAFTKENAAQSKGNRTATMTARIERRVLQKAKRELAGRGDLPATEDPVKPKRTQRLKV